jgi:hypothetical protein
MIDKIIRFEPAIKAVLIGGRWVFALAILCLGIERLACVGSLTGSLIETDRFGTPFGLALVACASVQAHAANRCYDAGQSALSLHTDLRGAKICCGPRQYGFSHSGV